MNGYDKPALTTAVTTQPSSSFLYSTSNILRSGYTPHGASPSPTLGNPSPALERIRRTAELAEKNKWDDMNRQKAQQAPVTGSGAPVAPPTLPKYSGTSFSGTDRPSYLTSVDKTSGYSGASYRLASLDRLAQRQRLYETQTNGEVGPPAAPTGSMALQSKRELFFKNESTTPTVTGTSTPASTSSIMSTSGTTLTNSAPAAATSAVQSAKEALLNSKENKVESIIREKQEDNKEKEKERERHKDREKPEKKTKELDGYVGFANLPNQVYRKAVKKGFEFTLMVVGESGLGKSTLINSMFLADVYCAECPGPSHRVKKTVQVETCKIMLKENGVNLTLTIADTPGFGDSVDNSNCWQPVVDYIENKYEEYLNAESRVNRKAVPDNRVHCCVYFLAPGGHGLKPLDVEFMKRLHDKVNIIPVIAKADTMTTDECSHFKKQILNEIAQQKIKIYEFPDCDDEEEKKVHKAMKERVPFAVVGSNTVIEVDGKKVRGRKYPWGVVEVENMDHCDFIPLRNMLIRTHMQDLKDVTNSVHYENYRCRKLAGIGVDGKPARIANKNPLVQMEEEKKEHENKMKKMESEMEQVFEMKVKEKQQKLKDSEVDLQRRHEQMKTQLANQQNELDEKRKAYDRERTVWEQANNITIEELRRRSLESNSKENVDGRDKNKKKKGLF